MPGPTEVHPVNGACRHLRARFKQVPGGRGPFPEKRFVRHECEQGREFADEDVEKCFEATVTCWQDAPVASG